MDIIWKLYP